jgi:hypothetical protein
MNESSQASREVKELPNQDQESIASIILLEIESEHRWDELFARPQSADLLSRMADEALAEVVAETRAGCGSGPPSVS